MSVEELEAKGMIVLEVVPAGTIVIDKTKLTPQFMKELKENIGGKHTWWVKHYQKLKDAGYDIAAAQ